MLPYCASIPLTRLQGRFRGFANSNLQNAFNCQLSIVN